jgi:hypothetical protein
MHPCDLKEAAVIRRNRIVVSQFQMLKARDGVVRIPLP